MGLSWSDLGSDSDSATCWEGDSGKGAQGIRLLVPLLIKWG